MKVLGLDVGDKSIGVAISDSLLLTAQGRETIFRESIKKDISRIIDYIAEEDVQTIVVGLPKNMNGTLGPQAEKTKKFVAKLLKKIKYTSRIENTNINIQYIDERLTSIQADRMLIDANVRRNKRKQVIDKVAAVYILQTYLDQINNNRGENSER